MSMKTIIKGGNLVIPYEGVKKADIMIEDGIITAIGNDLNEHNAEIIDATGKHIFPGAIDGHSHYGVYGSLAEDYY